MKKNNKGFTLIELLAVIVILAIIALITVPTVLNIIENAKKGAAADSAYAIEEAARYYYMARFENFSESEFNCTTEGCLLSNDNTVKLDIKGTIPSSGTVVIERNGDVTVSDLVINGYSCIKTNDEYSCGNEIEIPIVPVAYKETILNGADPVLDEGMIPVNISNDGTLTKADLYSEWYDYETKKWANVVIVNNSSLSGYKSADIGTLINKSDVLGYFVWIPRYKYQIFYDGTILMNQDSNANTVELINITFENKNTVKSNGTIEDTWLTHPAFTFGSEELNGFWVAKFETTGDAVTPTVLPNVTSLRNQNVSTQFAASRKFNTTETYGLVETDSHMMKNSEWGAVAYLTTSNYGQGLTEIRINNSETYTTGCAASIENGSLFNGCQNKYNTTIGYLASTTGNITGIYDMSGGAREAVMGVMQDSTNTNTPMSGSGPLHNSGYNGFMHAEGKMKTDGIAFPNSKYYDLYSYGTTYRDAAAYQRGKLGDATIELGSFSTICSTWNKDNASFVYFGDPWFVRSGYFSSGSASGVFAFTYSYGSAHIGLSFRVVLSN